SRRVRLGVYPSSPPGFAVENRLASSGRGRCHRLDRAKGKAGHVDQPPQLTVEVALSRRKRRRQRRPLIAARHGYSFSRSAQTPGVKIGIAACAVPSCPNLSQLSTGSYASTGIPDRTETHLGGEARA